MKTKGAQYWILLIAAGVISVLLVAQIFISRAIVHEQHFLIDQREAAEAGPYYKQAWQDLAVQVWKGSAQDPALLDLLKSEGIGVHQGLPPGTAPAATNAAPATPSSASMPGTPSATGGPLAPPQPGAP
jgi:hypothetical protein